MQVSELLRGEGLYPTWELTSSVITVLQIPRAPMLHLWQSAAIEVHKDRAWIENCIKQFIQIPGEDVAPVDQACFVATSTPHYIRYGSVFLGTTLATVAVNETNHLLWLRWEEILGSRDLHQTAWQVLRHRVMARTPHTDGRPVLRSAAQFTRALREPSIIVRTAAAYKRQFEESPAMFEAISDLPDAQMDVTVLLHVCGMDVPTAADVLGVPPAIVRSEELHAKRALAATLALLAPDSPVTPAGPDPPAGPPALAASDDTDSPPGPPVPFGRPSGPSLTRLAAQTPHHPTEGTSR